MWPLCGLSVLCCVVKKKLFFKPEAISVVHYCNSGWLQKVQVYHSNVNSMTVTADALLSVIVITGWLITCIY